MKNIIIVAIVALLVGGVVGYFLVPATMGGLVNNGKYIPVKYDFRYGFDINGVDVMDADRLLNYREDFEAVTATNVLTHDESGKTIYLSGATSTQTLPLVTTADGDIFRFVIAGSVTGNITIVTSDASNIIDGTLIVAGAVVDCDSEDTITIVADGENVGDFVELRSNGTKWFIGASGVLTGSKMTCSAT